MGLYRLPALIVFAAVASSGALAFQEQQVGGQKPAVQAPAPAQPSAGVVEVAPSLPQGTEVRIPGIGKLGVIPKLDFGLELLYGATDGKKAEPEKPEDDGMVVRGTIKHKF